MIKISKYLVCLMSVFLMISFDLYAQRDTNKVYINAPLEPMKNGWVNKIDNYSYRICDGKRCNGFIVDTFENGKIRRSANYVDGNIVGIELEYYESGQLKTFSNNVGIKDSILEVICFYPSGKIESEWYSLNNINYFTKMIEYYESGKIESYEYTDINTLEIESYMFTENGDTTLACFPINKRKTLFRYFDKNDDGTLNEEGYYKVFRNYGQVRYGEWKTYNEKGELIETKRYRKKDHEKRNTYRKRHYFIGIKIR